MLGIVILFLAGREFYRLADNHDKQKWGYAIGAIALYYVTSFIAAFVIILVLSFTIPETVETTSDTVLGLSGVPFGIAACYFLYHFLKKKWVKEAKAVGLEINNIGRDPDSES